MLKFKTLRKGDVVAYESHWANLTGIVKKIELTPQGWDSLIWLSHIKAKSGKVFEESRSWTEDECFRLILREESPQKEKIKAKNGGEVTFTIIKKRN